jgi:hypothetical protein
LFLKFVLYRHHSPRPVTGLAARHTHRHGIPHRDTAKHELDTKSTLVVKIQSAIHCTGQGQRGNTAKFQKPPHTQNFASGEEGAPKVAMKCIEKSKAPSPRRIGVRRRRNQAKRQHKSPPEIRVSGGISLSCVDGFGPGGGPRSCAHRAPDMAHLDLHGNATLYISRCFRDFCGEHPLSKGQSTFSNA